MGIFTIKEKDIDALISRIESLEKEKVGVMVGGISNTIKEIKLGNRYDGSISYIHTFTEYFATMRSIKEKEYL